MHPDKFTVVCLWKFPSPHFFFDKEILAELVSKQNFHPMGNSNTWGKREDGEVFRD